MPKAAATSKAKAKPAATAAFAGFDRDAVQFLHELAANMTKEWFAANKQRYEARWVAPMQALLDGVAATRPPEPPLDRLVVKVGEAWVPVPLAQVLRLSADDKYVCLHTASGEHLVRQSMRRLEARLDPSRFVRVHRSDIVNLDAVARLEPYSHGDGILVLHDGTTVILSRGFRAEFLRRWGAQQEG